MRKNSTSARLEQVAARLATQALLLATGPLLARATGPQGRGEAAIGVALAVLLPPVVGLGFGSAVRALASEGSAGGLMVAGLRRGVVGSLAAAVVGVSIVGSGVLDVGEATRPVVVAAATTAGISAVVDGVVSWRLVQGRSRQAALARVVPVAVFAAYCTVLFALGSLSAVTYLVGYALLPVLRLAVAASGGGWPPTSSGPVPAWGRTGRWGIPHELSDAGLAQVAVLSAGLVLDAGELGLLAVALTVARLPIFVASGVTDSDVGAIAAARAEGRRFEANRAAIRVSGAVAVISVGLAAVGWIAVPVVFGAEFASSRPALLVLLVASPATAAVGYLSGYLVASGAPTSSTRLQLLLFGAVAAGTGVGALVARQSLGSDLSAGQGASAAAAGFSAVTVAVGLWALLRPESQVRP